ncbi:MAG: aldo/keto reductase [Gemmatimonadetes bacterium]|nr:aldo/keto reductase [Gemmatimonadota bacterium]
MSHRENRIAMKHGGEIPLLGLGVYRSEPGGETRQAVEWALDAGYRHIDTASAYGNERDVGEAIRASGIPRDEIFITTKLANEEQGFDSALRAIDASLEELDLDRVDLYLMHWPLPDKRLESWRAMERMLKDGRTRAIGVSNFMVQHLRELLECDVQPAVNQIELSPYNFLSRADVVALCRQHGIVLEAYSPLTKARRLDDPTVGEIADSHGKTPAQVLIRYAIDKDFVAIPKSTNHQRIRENADVFDFQLSDQDLNRLDALDEGLATGWDPTDEP